MKNLIQTFYKAFSKEPQTNQSKDFGETNNKEAKELPLQLPESGLFETLQHCLSNLVKVSRFSSLYDEDLDLIVMDVYEKFSDQLNLCPSEQECISELKKVAEQYLNDDTDPIAPSRADG